MPSSLPPSATTIQPTCALYCCRAVTRVLLASTNRVSRKQLKQTSTGTIPASRVKSNISRMTRQMNTVVVLHPLNNSIITLDFCLQLDDDPSASVWRKSMARSEDDTAMKTIERLQILLVQQKAEKKSQRVTREELLKDSPEIQVFSLESDEHEAKKTEKEAAAAAVVPPSSSSSSAVISTTNTNALRLLDPSVPNKDFWKQAKQMLIRSTVVSVKYNVPTITSITPPSALYVGIPSICSGITTLFTSEPNLRYEWCMHARDCSEETTAISVISRDVVFIPKEEHVGKSLLLRVSPEGDSDLWTQIDLPPVRSPLPPMDRWKYTKERAEAPSFRVVTYNILHDELCTTSTAKKCIYPFATDDILALENRQVRILQELLAYNTDLICLQECGKKVYNQFFERTLQHLGYDGRYTNKNGNVREGCACFWKRDRFSMKETFDFPLNWSTLQEDHPELASRVSDYPHFKEALENITSIGAVVVLTDLHTNEELLVGNTHLFYHANGCHIRLLQAYMLLNRVKKYSESRRCCLLLCGDFNFTQTTGGYQLVTTGQTEESHHSWKKGEVFYWGCDRLLGISTGEAEELGDGNNVNSSTATEVLASKDNKPSLPLEAFRETLQAPLQLRDSYKEMKEELPWTNYAMTFREVIDYIFFSPTRLSVVRAVPIPPESELSENVALPNKKYPSDHLALVADMKYISTSSSS